MKMLIENVKFDMYSVSFTEELEWEEFETLEEVLDRYDEKNLLKIVNNQVRRNKLQKLKTDKYREVARKSLDS
jgi:chromosome condensin MukBEF MukE localization factor